MRIGVTRLNARNRKVGVDSTTHPHSRIEPLEGRLFFSAAVARSSITADAVSTVMIDHGGIVPPTTHGGQGGSDYQLETRWSQTATDGFTGGLGTPITLTWGFVADGVIIPKGTDIASEVTSPSILQARLTTLYGSMTAAQAVFQQIFDRWSVLTGITYTYTGLSDDGAAFRDSPGVLGVRPDVRIGGHHIDGSSNVLAYDYFPDSSDMVVDTDELTGSGYMTNTQNNSRRLRNVLAHEHGHGLGLDHVDPINQTKLMEAFVSTLFDGPQYDDILAVQTLYGDPLEKNGRNETGATATNKGALAIGSTTLATGVSISNADVDDFKITLTTDRTVGFTLSPVGTTYDQGPQGQAVSPFNSAAQSDLVLSIYASNGTTLIRNVNATGVGAAESIANLNLPAGTYVVSVTGSGSTQMYSLTGTSAALVSVPPSAPSTPDLDFLSDSGSSNADNITNITTPTFTGTSGPLTTISLLADGAVVGTTTSDSDGSWAITAGALSNGVHVITAAATNGAGTTPGSGSLNVTIDTQAPTLVIAFDRDVTQNITFTFSDPVASQLIGAEVSVVNLTTPGAVLPSSLTSSGAVATKKYTGLFADGRYKVSVVANAVADLAGNNSAAATYTFAQLAGDADNDGAVGFSDLVILAQNYNLSGKTFSQGNFNYDSGGNVDFSDLVILAQKYNVSLPALSAEIAAPPQAGPASSGDGGKSLTKKPSRDVLA